MMETPINLRGFDSPESEYYLELLDTAEVSRVRPIRREGDTFFYSLPGLPLCWKCTVKHIGQAVGFASEVEAYPERIICVVGELGHAYRECPDKEVATAIRDTYTKILETGCVPDFTELLKKVYAGWMSYLQDDK